MMMMMLQTPRMISDVATRTGPAAGGQLERDIEQAITALKKGAYLLKYGRRGKPKFCPFRLSNDESVLIWFSGKEEKHLKLSHISRIVSGQRTPIFQRYPRPEKEYQSFSLIYNDRSLDLICKDKDEAEVWFSGLKALISRGHQRKWRTESRSDGIPSGANSPRTYTRRSSPLHSPFGSGDGSQKDTGDQIPLQSPFGSPPKNIQDMNFYKVSPKGFFPSDSASGSVHSLSSRGSDSIHGHTRVMGVDAFRVSLSSAVSSSSQGSGHDDGDALGDVFLWGEITGDGGSHRIGSSIGAKTDSLLPKALESAVVLDVQNIACGGRHAALVTKQGEIFSWGEESGGRLGHGVDSDVLCPKLIESLSNTNIEFVACGEYHTCAVTLSGELYTWGDGHFGILGHGNEVSHWVPKRVNGPLEGIHVSFISCGPFHTAVVTSAGQLFTFGDGTFGVLGHGNCQSLTEPKQVESLRGMRVKSVACGTWHTAAIVGFITGPSKSSTQSGKLFTWGDGDKGRLGHGNSETKDKPTCVLPLIDHDFVQVSCGRMLTVGLTTTGVVYTIGSSIHGQLGNPMAQENSIALVQGKLKFEFVREIATGSYHVAVLTSSGNVYTWGKGVNGQLGVGDIEDRSSPTLVDALQERQVQSICCGPSSTAAVCLHKSTTCGMDQSVCRGCNTEFGFMKKKHNCYNCGLLFCNICSSNKAKNACLAPDGTKSFRVCDCCYKGVLGQMVRIEDLTPRPLLIKTFSEETGDRNRVGSGSGLDLESGSLRWGQVSSPASFRKHCKEEYSLKVMNIGSDVNVNQQNACQGSVKSTVKLKGAKNVIKALTSRLQSMSPRAFMRKQAKPHVDAPTTSIKFLTSGATHVQSNEVRDPNNLCKASLVPTRHNVSPSDQLTIRTAASGQNIVKQKDEWMEQYQPGVYITFIMLPTGQKGIKRVRFSRKVFREREAERWWEDNQQRVYDHYNVDGYINSF